ncbi:MAG: pyridoxal phosphate-dependent aminotransferase [Vicinamibacteria bacterium]
MSPTVAMAQRASAFKARGERILDFSVGEPDRPTPERICRAACEAALHGETRYTPSAGIPALREAVAQRYRQDAGAAFEPSQVVITAGGKQALYSSLQCLVDHGDEVIVPSPCWPSFPEAVRLAGGRPVLVAASARGGFRLTAALVRRGLSARTRAVIVNSPCNPTGSVIAPEELLAIGRLAKRHGFVLFYDDTYASLTYEGGPQPLEPLRRLLGDRFAILGTASKTYCMTGWRIGWLLGPKPLAEAVTALASHSTQCATSFAQVGAVEALRGPQDDVAELREEYRRRRDAIHSELVTIPGVRCARPAGAFYLYADVKAHLGGAVSTTLELAQRLLDEQRLAVVPGEAFGTPGYLRIFFGRVLPELREGAARLRSFLGGLGAPRLGR